jgi:hypothetical protein
VHLERIFLARNCRDAALRVVCIRLRLVFLGDDRNAPMRRNLEGKGKSGNAAAENKKIKGLHRPRR